MRGLGNSTTNTALIQTARDKAVEILKSFEENKIEQHFDA